MMADHPRFEVQRVFSGAPWERKVGYCRAIHMGNAVAVTGTVSVDDQGDPHAVGDPYGQAKRCLEIIEKALRELGVDWPRVFN